MFTPLNPNAIEIQTLSAWRSLQLQHSWNVQLEPPEGDPQVPLLPLPTTKCSSIPGCPCFWPVSLCFSFSSGRFSSLSCSASSNSSSPWLLGSSAGFTSSMAAFCNLQEWVLNTVSSWCSCISLERRAAWAVRTNSIPTGSSWNLCRVRGPWGTSAVSRDRDGGACLLKSQNVSTSVPEAAEQPVFTAQLTVPDKATEQR